MLKWIIYAFEWTVFYLCCRENKHHSTAQTWYSVESNPGIA